MEVGKLDEWMIEVTFPSRLVDEELLHDGLEGECEPDEEAEDAGGDPSAERSRPEHEARRQGTFLLRTFADAKSAEGVAFEL